MDRYIEIQILPDPEFNTPLLLGALVSKLHRGFAALDNGNVGISFPGLKLDQPASLGERVRLHGAETQLSRLMASNWLTGMQDHIKVSDLAPVPAEAGHRTFYRVQAKSSPERLRRRRMKRTGENLESARKAIPDNVGKRLALPYLTLTSQSTGQRFPLFINAGPTVENPVSGTFNSYGLSRNATVPWF